MAARRGRVGGFRLTDEHRSKIKSSQILNALAEHTLGTRKMSSSQVSAGVALLKKVMPDLAAVDNTTLLTVNKRAEDMTDDELATIAAQGDATHVLPRARESSKVH